MWEDMSVLYRRQTPFSFNPDGKHDAGQRKCEALAGPMVPDQPLLVPGYGTGQRTHRNLLEGQNNAHEKIQGTGTGPKGPGTIPARHKGVWDILRARGARLAVTNRWARRLCRRGTRRLMAADNRRGRGQRRVRLQMVRRGRNDWMGVLAGSDGTMGQRALFMVLEASQWHEALLGTAMVMVKCLYIEDVCRSMSR